VNKDKERNEMAAKKTPTRVKTASSDEPISFHDAIALRAYAIFLERGCVHGWDVEDWLEAEQQLLAESKKTPAKRKRSTVVASAA
jgi:hypothetical protein